MVVIPFEYRRGLETGGWTDVSDESHYGWLRKLSDGPYVIRQEVYWNRMGNWVAVNLPHPVNHYPADDPLEQEWRMSVKRFEYCSTFEEAFVFAEEWAKGKKRI